MVIYICIIINDLPILICYELNTVLAVANRKTEAIQVAIHYAHLADDKKIIRYCYENQMKLIDKFVCDAIQIFIICAYLWRDWNFVTMRIAIDCFAVMIWHKNEL